MDIKQYLEVTNTVLVTKETFEYLKDCADIVKKIRNGVPREDLGFPVSAEFYNSVLMMVEAHDFAKWVATEIFDDNWEYNKDAFGELACRKLAKLGIVRAKGDEWELVESQERSYKK